MDRLVDKYCWYISVPIKQFKQVEAMTVNGRTTQVSDTMLPLVPDSMSFGDMVELNLLETEFSFLHLYKFGTFAMHSYLIMYSN